MITALVLIATTGAILLGAMYLIFSKSRPGDEVDMDIAKGKIRITRKK